MGVEIDIFGVQNKLMGRWLKTKYDVWYLKIVEAARVFLTNFHIYAIIDMKICQRTLATLLKKALNKLWNSRFLSHKGLFVRPSVPPVPHFLCHIVAITLSLAYWNLRFLIKASIFLKMSLKSLKIVQMPHISGKKNLYLS
jgi:hypothetical protein